MYLWKKKEGKRRAVMTRILWMIIVGIIILGVVVIVLLEIWLIFKRNDD